MNSPRRRSAPVSAARGRPAAKSPRPGDRRSHPRTTPRALDMDTRTTIVLADDQLLVRAGIKCLLETYPHFQIVGESHDGLAVVEMVAELRPDVLLVDVALPGLYGPEVVRRV